MVNKVVQEFGKVKHKIQLFKNLVVRGCLENKGMQEIECNVNCCGRYSRESLEQGNFTSMMLLRHIFLCLLQFSILFRLSTIKTAILAVVT